MAHIKYSPRTRKAARRKQLVFRIKSKLTKGLTAWMNQSPSQKERKSLDDYLPKGEGSEIKTEAEARLVCSAFDHARNLCGEFEDWSANHDLHTAIALMQQVGSAEAKATLIQHGLPRLRKLVRERLSNPKVEHAMFALKLIGYYRQPEDVELFVTAIRAPLEPDSFWWQPALYGFTEDNPCTQMLVDRLSDPLPTEFIRIVFLDKCNALAVGGHLKEHPFAAPHGVAALESCLTARDADRYSHAVSACTALPFLRPDDRDRLLKLASEHPDMLVRIETAWVSAKVGNQEGVKALIEFARDARYSTRATAYMKELGLDSHSPAEVMQPDFVARAEMSDWLAHPSEMGQPPDHLVLVDSREL
ncbi:MAG TPA: HEAT repeat domain-containing protein, partial [Nitrospiraceae bacterium]|nr:HEAT repeat domain-containing protein [Nitrospiraceae bacterium]